MKISPEKMTEIIGLLNKNWKGQKICPICGNNNWNVSENIAEIREYNKGSFIVSGSVYPTVIITCNICGYTLNFNAIKLGILKTDTQEKIEQDTNKINENKV